MNDETIARVQTVVLRAADRQTMGMRQWIRHFKMVDLRPVVILEHWEGEQCEICDPGHQRIDLETGGGDGGGCVWVGVAVEICNE